MIWIALMLLVDLPQLRTLPEAQPLPEVKPTKHDWESAWEQAEKEQTPLVIWIRMEHRPVRGVITTRADSVYGHPGPCVLFAVPQRGRLEWFRGGPDWGPLDVEAAIKARLRVSVAPVVRVPVCVT